MSDGRSNRRRHRRSSLGPAVIVWGESPNDTNAIRSLILAINPSLEGRVLVRRPPLMMIKNATPQGHVGATRKTLAALQAEAAMRPLGCAVFHEDADAVEPAHEAIARSKEEALASAPCAILAVVPAWEIESWWFMWPDQVKAHNPTWRLPNNHLGKRVGLIVDAKEELQRLVTPPSHTGRFRGYEELDSPGIAEAIRAAGVVGSPGASSDSFERFRSAVAAM